MNVHDYLKKHGIPFETLLHPPTFDAQRLAQAVAETGHRVAKTVLLFSPETGYYLALVPATSSVDLAMARELLKVDTLRLATEEELADQFPDCEMGAAPPFGSQYGLPTLIDQSLCFAEEIVFEGNTHHEAFRMKLKDYLKLEEPTPVDMSCVGIG